MRVRTVVTLSASDWGDVAMLKPIRYNVNEFTIDY
jgi:hypothetical protein